MNAIAAQLSTDEIANVAAWFSAQAGPDKGAKSSFLPNLATSHVTFPEGYKDTFVKYHAITAMARNPGWGKDFPEMLRNEDWNYAVFTTGKQQRAGVNQAECLACHKPLDKVSYTFTLKQLAEAK